MMMEEQGAQRLRDRREHYWRRAPCPAGIRAPAWRSAGLAATPAETCRTAAPGS